MKCQQMVFGGQARSKLAGRKPKYMNYNCKKRNPNTFSASQKPQYKPPFLHNSSCFTTAKKGRRCFLQKTQSMEASRVYAPHAPRNTTSYIMRSKNCGGIPPLINTASASASASASLRFNTPPYNEGTVEQVNEEWGVDSYGSMKGLLRVRHMKHQNVYDFEPNLDKCVEILDQKVEQRLDQDLSRFEMVYPFLNKICPQILETRINGQDNQIAYLVEEGTIIRKRVDCMEQELYTLKLRMRVLEGANVFRLEKICSGEVSFT